MQCSFLTNVNTENDALDKRADIIKYVPDAYVQVSQVFPYKYELQLSDITTK